MMATSLRDYRLKPTPESTKTSKVHQYTSNFCFTSDRACSQLYSFQERNLLTDAVIVYDGIHFHCHSSIISAFSPVLKEKLLQSSTIEISLYSFLTDPELFISILKSFYGQPLPVTTQSAPILSLIASLLQFQELSEFVIDRMTKGFGNYDTNNFKLDPKVLFSKFLECCSRDVRVTYKNSDIMMNSLILALFSRTYSTSFTCNFADSAVRNFKYLDEFPGVTGNNLQLFFDLFHCKSIKLNISNVLDFFQLSVYFQVDELKLSCIEFLASNSFSETKLIYLLKISNERYQLNFVENNIEIFKNLSNISEEPFPLRSSFIVLLLSSIDIVWLFRCLMELHKVDPFIPSALSEILTTSILPDFHLIRIFEILKPLFQYRQFKSVLVEWSIKIFQSVQNFEIITTSWFFSILKEVDRNRCFSKYLNFLSDTFASVISPCCQDDHLNYCFSPTCLELLCSKLPCDYCLWLARSLVNSWKNSEEFNHSWSVDSFVKCVESITILGVNQLKFLKILQDLIDDDLLKLFLNTYLAKNSLDLLLSREDQLKVFMGLADPIEERAQRLFESGLDFLTGNVVNQNFKIALGLFEEAALLHHSESIFKLGSCYYLGLGVEKILKKQRNILKNLLN
ncbi:hypothetical protein GEMRC1_007889 [Eukaryota sp. GEM-RC1]